MKHVVVNIEDRLKAWRDAEQAACAAENEIASLGQAAPDPRVRDLFVRAKELREAADRQFAAILRSVRLEDDEQP